MPETPIIGSIMINAEDAQSLAGFWSRLLGVGIAVDHGTFIWLTPQRDGAASVAFQQVPDPTPGRRRLHLDLHVDDMDAAVARILELGGSHLEDHEIEGFAWKVMADPEGNEFCIVTHG